MNELARALRILLEDMQIETASYAGNCLSRAIAAEMRSLITITLLDGAPEPYQGGENE